MGKSNEFGRRCRVYRGEAVVKEGRDTGGRFVCADGRAFSGQDELIFEMDVDDLGVKRDNAAGVA